MEKEIATPEFPPAPNRTLGGLLGAGGPERVCPMQSSGQAQACKLQGRAGQAHAAWNYNVPAAALVVQWIRICLATQGM